jgi:hypothetical protein
MQSESGAARLSRQPRGKSAAAVNTASTTTVAIRSKNQTGLRLLENIEPVQLEKISVQEIGARTSLRFRIRGR